MFLKLLDHFQGNVWDADWLHLSCSSKLNLRRPVSFPNTSLAASEYWIITLVLTFQSYQSFFELWSLFIFRFPFASQRFLGFLLQVKGFLLDAKLIPFYTSEAQGFTLPLVTVKSTNSEEGPPMLVNVAHKSNSLLGEVERHLPITTEVLNIPVDVNPPYLGNIFNT